MGSPKRLLLRIALLATLAPRPAAAGLSARLVYLRSGIAEACPDQAALKLAVAKRLGYDPFLLSAPHMIVAELSGEGDVLQARARLLDESGIVLGTRELKGRGADCSELMASLALAISLTLDPLMVATEPTPEEATAEPGSSPLESIPAPEPPVADLTKPAPVAAPTPKRIAIAVPAAPTSLNVRAGLLGAFGWVPKASYGPLLGVSIRRQRLSVGLEGAALAAQSEATSGGLGASVSLSYAALTPCFWVGNVAACGIAALGRYTGEGSGVSAPRVGAHVQAAAGIRLMGSIPLSTSWSLGIFADAVGNLVRPSFLVAEEAVYRPSALAANIGLFLDWQLL